MAHTWYVEYFFKQHATFHEVFKTICVVTCRQGFRFNVKHGFSE